MADRSGPHLFAEEPVEQVFIHRQRVLRKDRVAEFLELFQDLVIQPRIVVIGTAQHDDADAVLALELVHHVAGPLLNARFVVMKGLKTRVHGALVTEAEISRVTEFWKRQATPEYDQSFLIAPPNEEEGAAETEAAGDEQDSQYEEAVRLVLQMGKASTSTLQRHLRLGYGRAARILDMMQRDGIIGPPDGSKPREVLKRPDWLREVENQLK